MLNIKRGRSYEESWKCMYKFQMCQDKKVLKSAQAQSK